MHLYYGCVSFFEKKNILCHSYIMDVRLLTIRRLIAQTVIGLEVSVCVSICVRVCVCVSVNTCTHKPICNPQSQLEIICFWSLVDSHSCVQILLCTEQKSLLGV